MSYSKERCLDYAAGGYVRPLSEEEWRAKYEGSIMMERIGQGVVFVKDELRVGVPTKKL